MGKKLNATADQNMDQAVDAYSEFVRVYPQHEKAPAALKNWAAVAQQKGDMKVQSLCMSAC